MDLENLTEGQVILTACFPIMFGLFIGLCIAIVKYRYMKHRPCYDNINNRYKWNIALDGVFTTGIITSYSLTFIGFLIWAIVYNWDKPL